MEPVATFGQSGYDRRELVASLGGDEQLAREVIQLYFEAAPKMLNTLFWEAENGNPLGVAHAAHAIQGAFSMLRAHAAAALASAVEQSSRCGDLSDAKKKLAELAQAAQRINEALRPPAICHSGADQPIR